MESKRHWQDVINLILGVWLFITPFIFEMTSSTGLAARNGYAFGIIICGLSIWALVQPQLWEEWTNLVVGLWLLISPFVLGFTADTAAMWNHIVVGVVVCLDAVLVVTTTPTPMRHT